MKEKKEKLTPKQIVKTALSFLAVAMVLAGVVIGILYNWMPRAIKLLPLPLIVAAIAILLILKSTGKSLDTVIPPPPELTEEDVPEEQATEPSEEKPTSSLNIHDPSNKKEPD